MKRFGGARRAALVGLALVVMSGASFPAAAQTITASIRGQAQNIDTRAPITARDVATNETVTANIDNQGRYALSGLRPGSYRLAFTGSDGVIRNQLVTVSIGQSLTLDLNGAATTTPAGSGTNEVVVTARKLVETKTSEVATNVSTQQIHDLPQTDRNFLSFAALAPGVHYNDSEYTRTFTAGAGNPGDVNVFIDGLSLKNDVEPGGLAGQEGSRGNPFPQLAVSEFRTLVQNYKAEYEQASSAIITAVTKSGTNQFHGEAFFQYTDKNLTAQDPFSAALGAPKPDYERKQYGAAFGGPIIKDKLFFFLAYEGNDQVRSEQVRLNQTITDPAQAALFDPYLGFFASPFHEDLYFGKLSWEQSDRNRIDASVNVRRETDVRGFGLNVAYSAGQRAQNEVDTYLVRDTFRGDNYVNEAAVSFLNYHYNPQSLTNGPTTNYAGYIETGGATETNDVRQKTFTIRDDFTRSGVDFYGNHTFKAGIKFSHQDYEINDQQYAQPYLEYRISTDPASPLFGQLDTQVPYLANLGVGNPDLRAHNNQIGVYIQDDWDVTSKLQVNLGLRWDYETNMFNNDFVTPANSAAALRSLPLTFYYTNPNDFITDGHQRSPEKDMFQPRIGFSYDIFGDQRTVVFGGYGRYFDRNIFAETLNERYYQQYAVQTYFFSRTGNVNDEGQPTIKIDPSQPGYQNNFTRQGLLALQAANPATTGLTQLFVVKNDARAPRTDQFTLGVRQRFGIFYTSITGTYIDGSHGITNIFVNRFPNGDCCVPTNYGYAYVTTLVDGLKWRYRGMYLTVDKPFTEQSGWGMSLAYTLAWATENGDPSIYGLYDSGVANSAQAGDSPSSTGGFYDYNCLSPDSCGFHPRFNDARHTIVFSGTLKVPFGFKLSTLTTLSTPLPYLYENYTNGFTYSTQQINFDQLRQKANCLGVFARCTVDVKLQKEFAVPGRLGQLSLYVDIFNLFNNKNYNRYDGYIGFGGTPSTTFGQPLDLLTSPRSVQFGADYRF